MSCVLMHGGCRDAAGGLYVYVYCICILQARLGKGFVCLLWMLDDWEEAAELCKPLRQRV